MNIDDDTLRLMGGCSVTRRIGMVKQPRGGYIKPKTLVSEVLGEGADALNPEESVGANLVGTAVDYLTRLMSGAKPADAFAISLMGAAVIGETEKAEGLLARVRGLDDESIESAVKLTGFDACRRASVMTYKPVEGINPDGPTVENVRTMVERSLAFLDVYGPKVLDGFTFGGGYTDLVSSGDGDFTTADTLWDFKVSKNPVKKEHTLQLLMYWRMGLHSVHPEFKDVRYLGIYNPRTNTASRIAVADIPGDVIAQVESKVIGYKV